MNRLSGRYRLTAAGKRALESERSVPAWYRAVLAVFHGDMTANEVLSSVSSDEALTWLTQLDTLGFVEQVFAVEPGPAPAEVTPDVRDDAVNVDGSFEVPEGTNQRTGGFPALAAIG